MNDELQKQFEIKWKEYYSTRHPLDIMTYTDRNKFKEWAREIFMDRVEREDEDIKNEGYEEGYAYCKEEAERVINNL